MGWKPLWSGSRPWRWCWAGVYWPHNSLCPLPIPLQLSLLHSRRTKQMASPDGCVFIRTGHVPSAHSCLGDPHPADVPHGVQPAHAAQRRWERAPGSSERRARCQLGQPAPAPACPRASCGQQHLHLQTAAAGNASAPHPGTALRILLLRSKSCCAFRASILVLLCPYLKARWGIQYLLEVGLLLQGTAGPTTFWLMHLIWGSGKVINLVEKSKDGWKLCKVSLWAGETSIIFLAKDK